MAEILSIGDMCSHEFARRAFMRMADISESLQCLADEEPDTMLFYVEYLLAERTALDRIIETIKATKLTKFGRMWK